MGPTTRQSLERRIGFLLPAVVAVACILPAWADVRLASVFSDHMVLQRGITVPVWGTDDAGEEVVVVIEGAEATTTADADGAWSVDLPSMYAGGPYSLIVEGSTRVELTDVLVGDVWVGSGQSNMQWTVANSDDPENEIAGANYADIRAVRSADRLGGACRLLQRDLDAMQSLHRGGLLCRGVLLRTTPTPRVGRADRADPLVVGRHAH